MTSASDAKSSSATNSPASATTALELRTSILDWPRSRKRMAVVFLDCVLSILATWAAFTLRLDTPHWPKGLEWFAYAATPFLAVPIFARFGLYRAIFRYTGIAAIITVGRAVAVYFLALLPVVFLLHLGGGIPRSLSVLQPLVLLILVASSRALGWYWLAGMDVRPARRLLIYGAGAAGAQTAAALAGTQEYALLGFLDDDAGKAGRSINGVTVHPPSEAADIVKRFRATDILLALPSVTRERRNKIIAQLQSLPVRIRSLPGLADLASGRVTVDDFKDLDVEDLLAREPVAPRPELLSHSIRDRVVLVTGAGGSIGSELSRQIALESPSELLLVEHSEYALYRIHQDLSALLERRGLHVRLHPVLADACNFDRIHALCAAHRPSLIYHAAAYKHVPIVESNPGTGIVNNVLGTLNVARAALLNGVGRFVLISTDKAVRPTNVMGASKRVAELVLQALAAEEDHPFVDELGQASRDAVPIRTCFSIVRFGNVLGSSGSVVPLFRAQIAEGGPLTITHPDITRYFMTISEAAQLVLHAGALAKDGDLFVLDMGAPVKVLDLAKRMIALAGRTVCDDERPTGDIRIVFTGLRPGEKLFEELLIGENPLPTEHPRIVRARESFMPWRILRPELEALLHSAQEDDVDRMMVTLRLLVPDYKQHTEATLVPSMKAP